jgi:hypothetical protein
VVFRAVRSGVRWCCGGLVRRRRARAVPSRPVRAVGHRAVRCGAGPCDDPDVTSAVSGRGAGREIEVRWAWGRCWRPAAGAAPAACGAVCSVQRARVGQRVSAGRLGASRPRTCETRDTHPRRRHAPRDTTTTTASAMATAPATQPATLPLRTRALARRLDSIASSVENKLYVAIRFNSKHYTANKVHARRLRLRVLVYSHGKRHLILVSLPMFFIHTLIRK